MNKQELIYKVAADTGMTQKQVADTLDCILRSIMGTVAEGEKVKLVGFGTFEARQRNPRSGYTPLTREAFSVPPFVSPVFKAGKGFKDLVNRQSMEEKENEA